MGEDNRLGLVRYGAPKNEIEVQGPGASRNIPLTPERAFEFQENFHRLLRGFILREGELDYLIIEIRLVLIVHRPGGIDAAGGDEAKMPL